MKYAKLGSVSHGTMREEDLIPRFCDALLELAKLNFEEEPVNRDMVDIYIHLDVIQEIQRRYEHDSVKSYYGTDEASEDLNEFLFEALNQYAPPLCYFGSHPGDGSDYGFWISEDAVREAEDIGIPVIRDEDMLLLVDGKGNPTALLKGGERIWEV